MASQNRAIVDKLLTNVSQAYVPTGLIAEQVFPFIGVSQSTGKLAKYGNAHLRIENSVKVGRGKYRQVEAIIRDTSSYSIKGHGLEGMVTADDYRNVEAPFDAEKDETMGLTTMIALEKEQALAQALTNTSLLAQNGTPTNLWSDYSNGSPVNDLVTAHTAVINGSGMQANVAIMDRLTAMKIRFSPDFLDKLGYKQTRPGGLNDQELANVLGVQKLLISDAAYNSAKEGQPDQMTRVWGKGLILAVLPDSAAPYQTSLGYRIGFANQQTRQVYKYDINNPPGSKAILVEDNYDWMISNAKAAYLFTAVIA